MQMGVLRWLADKFEGETRANPTSWDLLGTIDGHGPITNARTAENLATVFACVQSQSAALASLPAIVYRREGDARIEDPSHPVARLIRRGPNDRQTWCDFSEWLVASVLLRGNALVEVVRDNSGTVQSLEPIPWDWVTVELLPNNRLAFDIFAPIIAGSLGRRRRLLQSQVIHLKDRSDDGYVGRSRLSRAAEVVTNAMSAQSFANGFFANSANPSGAISYEKSLNEESRGRLRAELDKGYVGAKKAGRVMILDNGLKWQQISINPEDAELLDSRRFTTEEIARLFGVPPPIVGIWDHSSFTNSETAGRWFVTFTIGPWARKIEAEFARSVFETDGVHELELDMSAFLKGYPLSRWQSHQIALQNRVLTPNEVRQQEGWNKRKGGDEFEEPKQGLPIGRPEPEPEPAAA